MSESRSASVQANGITFRYLELGAGPLVLCLHGFPDNAHTFGALMPALAAAHPGAARGDLAVGDERLKGAWHAYVFQMPFAEQAVAASDDAFLERWWRDASPECVPPPERMESVKSTFRQPGVLTAALSYYRHTFHPANRDPALHDLQELPTSALHGTRDRPGRLEAFEAMDHLFPAGVEKAILPGAGHVLHLERQDEVSRRIVAFLRSA
jgi:pimeloyl-ACP methyl ester carboxylesterase